jgi:hypothetical protein
VVKRRRSADLRVVKQHAWCTRTIIGSEKRCSALEPLSCVISQLHTHGINQDSYTTFIPLKHTVLDNTAVIQRTVSPLVRCSGEIFIVIQPSFRSILHTHSWNYRIRRNIAELHISPGIERRSAERSIRAPYVTGVKATKCIDIPHVYR